MDVGGKVDPPGAGRLAKPVGHKKGKVAARTDPGGDLKKGTGYFDYFRKIDITFEVVRLNFLIRS